MKKIMRKLAAAAAAAVMSVSAFGTTVSAEKIADSWEWDEDSYMWKYCLPDGSYAGTEKARQLYVIDGVTYSFSFSGVSIGKYTGWAKSSDGTRRRYSNGLPYTGWLKYKSGQMRYCLDGYMATDNMQIGDHIYTFDDDGYYTGKTALTLITKCDKIVSSDTDEIKVALKNLDGRDYNFGVLSSMERWEKGEWVNCWGDWKGENGEELAYVSIGYFLGNKGDMTELDFNPQLYTNYNFTEGYYRIPIGSWIGNYKNQYESYAMFQVVPPVEVKASESVYLDTGNGVKVDFTAEIKSDKLETDDLDAHIFRMTADGWKDITEHTYSDGEVSTEVVPIIGKKNAMSSYGMLVKDGAGYYKAVVNTRDGKEYEDYFRIEQLEAKPWLDAYSNKDKNLTVLFDVHNKLDRDIEMHTFAYDIYRMEDGSWVDPEEARIAYTDVEIGEPFVLESGERVTIEANVSANYDASKLKAGEYAVYINGVGYGKFNIVNSKPDEDKLPFADLDANDIEKIKMKVWSGSHVTGTTESRVDIKNIATALRQLELSEKVKAFPDAEGGSEEITIYYKDGSSVEIYLFAGVVRYDGQLYKVKTDEFSYAVSEFADRIVFGK